MLSADQIAYIREWAKSGNEPREWPNVPVFARYGLTDSGDHGGDNLSLWLDSIGLTIAALAEALEQAATTADLMFGATEPGRVSRDDRAELAETIRNRKTLLG